MTVLLPGQQIECIPCIEQHGIETGEGSDSLTHSSPRSRIALFIFFARPFCYLRTHSIQVS